MSAQELREAAALMRSRAEAAKKYEAEEGWWQADIIFEAFTAYADDDEAVIPGGRQDAEHLAAWSPAVALAVADWLESAASGFVEGEPLIDAALAVARAYLEGDQ